jgi:hypothetical protein
MLPKFKCIDISQKIFGGDPNESHRVMFEPEPHKPGRIQIYTSEEASKKFEVGKIYSLNLKPLKTKAVKEKQ